jgi:hypothetical protein
MTHPGVGPLTALAYELVIGTPQFFNCGKQIASYVGAGSVRRIQPRSATSISGPSLRVTRRDGGRNGEGREAGGARSGCELGSSRPGKLDPLAGYALWNGEHWCPCATVRSGCPGLAWHSLDAVCVLLYRPNYVVRRTRHRFRSHFSGSRRALR